MVKDRDSVNRSEMAISITFFVKGQMIHIVSSVRCVVSVTTIELQGVA